MSQHHTANGDRLPQGSQRDETRTTNALDHTLRSSVNRHTSSSQLPAEHHRSRHYSSSDNHGTPSVSGNHRSRSTRHLLRLLLEAEQNAADLRRILSTALTRTDAESKRADEAERRASEAQRHLVEAHSAASAAEDDAKRARDDLTRWQARLESARSEIERARAAQRKADNLRMEAERSAKRYRDALHRLEEENIIRDARAEGRMEGFEQGFSHASGHGNKTYDLPIHRQSRGSRTWTPRHDRHALDNDLTEANHRLDRYSIPNVDDDFPSLDVNNTRGFSQTAELSRHTFNGLDMAEPSGVQSSSSSVIRSRFVEQMSEPPDTSDINPNPPSPDLSEIQPELETERQAEMDPPPLPGSRTPPVHVYTISIPPQDELERPPNVDENFQAAADSDAVPIGRKRSTRSGRFIHYLSAAKPRRWSSIKSNATTISARSNTLIPDTTLNESHPGLELAHEGDAIATEEADGMEQSRERSTSLIPSGAEVREILGGIIRPFRSLRRRKTDSSHVVPVEHYVDLREIAHWQNEDFRDPYIENPPRKNPVLAFTRRALRRKTSRDSPAPEITVISPSQSSSSVSHADSFDHPSPAEQTDHNEPSHPDIGLHSYHSPPTPDSPALNTPSAAFMPPPPHIEQDAWTPPGFVPTHTLVKSPRYSRLTTALPTGPPLHRKERGTRWAWDSSVSGSEEGMS